MITGLPQDFHRSLGNRDSSRGVHKQNLVYAKTQKKGVVTPQETEPKLPIRVGGSPVELRVGRGSLQGQWHWQRQAWKAPFGISPLGGCL